MSCVFVVTSGKGGTGKTAFTGGVSTALASQGFRVLCIDCDIGLRNLDISLGMADTALMDFSDVMEGRCPLLRAVAPHPTFENLFLLTAPLSAPPSPLLEADFCALLDEARLSFDYILIDSPAGLGLGFQLATCGADEAVVVSTSDASSLRDAQRVVSQISSFIPSIRLVVNRVQRTLLRRLGATVDDLMDFVGLPLLGLVPEDSQVILSADRGMALLQENHTGAALAYRNIAKRMAGRQVPLMTIR